MTPRRAVAEEIAEALLAMRAERLRAAGELPQNTGTRALLVAEARALLLAAEKAREVGQASSTATRPASSRATGTRNGEQET